MVGGMVAGVVGEHNFSTVVVSRQSFHFIMCTNGLGENLEYFYFLFSSIQLSTRLLCVCCWVHPIGLGNKQQQAD